MSIEKKFELATRTKMRFPFRGQATVEDLWDLSVENLDKVFKTLNAEKKQVQEESLLDEKSKEEKELAAKIEIVKHIVSTKLDEAKSRQETRAKKEQKQKILEILAAKKEENLQNKSVEELQAMIAEIDGSEK